MYYMCFEFGIALLHLNSKLASKYFKKLVIYI